jgi:hypothetical protein
MGQCQTRAGPLYIRSRPPSLAWPRTSTCANRTPGMGSGPPRMGSRPTTVGSQGSRIEHTRTLTRTQAGVRSRHVSRPGLVGSGPIRIHSCSPLRRRPDAATWHKPTGGTWHDASGLRAPSHSLQIRRMHVHFTDRWRAQSMIRGPHSYSHVTISREMTHHYSYGYCLSMLHGLQSS